MDRQAAQRAIAAFLAALGHPAEGELAQTPALVADAWIDELLSGYRHDPAAILRAAAIPRAAAAAGAAAGPEEWVALRDLHVVTMCPHHLLPAHGLADVVYLPAEQLVGFGAVGRALSALARRLTLQETTGRALATLLVDELGASAALCRLRMTHTCMVARGGRQHGARVETLAVAGAVAGEPAVRQAALAMLAGGAL